MDEVIRSWVLNARGIVSLKFLLETRLKSESYEPLIDFLGWKVMAKKLEFV